AAARPSGPAHPGAPAPAPAPAQPGQRREFAAAGARPAGPAGPAYRSPGQPYAVPFDPRPEPPKERNKPRTAVRGLAPMVLLACAIVILAVAAFCTGGGSSSHKSTPTPSSVFGTSAPLAPAVHTTSPDPTVPPETPGKVCYPLQPC
ncbi:hypothetical protein EBN03_33065, partial [Nocardia stercoris]